MPEGTFGSCGTARGICPPNPASIDELAWSFCAGTACSARSSAAKRGLSEHGVCPSCSRAVPQVNSAAPLVTFPTESSEKSGTTSLSPTRRAASSTTSIAEGSCGHDTTVEPSFTMPAFSWAISASVLPSRFVWSSAIDTIAATSGAAMTLVESSRPPSPTSSTTISQPTCAKCTSATAVISSNSVGCSPPSASIASAHSRTRSVAAVRSSSEMLRPFTRMRSWKVST